MTKSDKWWFVGQLIFVAAFIVTFLIIMKENRIERIEKEAEVEGIANVEGDIYTDSRGRTYIFKDGSWVKKKKH